MNTMKSFHLRSASGTCESPRWPIKWLVSLGVAVLAGGCAASGGQRNAHATEPFAPALTAAMAVQQVRVAELAFAKAMADRDFTAFMSHVSPNAIFFGGKGIEHGTTEIGIAWKPLFNDFEAPFAWAPDDIEVLPTGDLAFSTGPVVIKGKVVGRYNSVWRMEAPNTWRIVFDKGETVCESPLNGAGAH